MIQILTREQAAERGLFTTDPVTGEKVPFTSWRMELTEQQQQEHEKQVANGTIPF